jgi:hypothetical protein
LQPGPPLVDLEQRAVGVGEVVRDERLVDPLHVHVDAPVLLVHVQSGVVAAVRRDAVVAEDLGDDRLAEQTAELDPVVERRLPQAEEPAVLVVVVELDQEAPLVGLLRVRRTVALEPDRHVLDRDVPPPEGRRHVDEFR